MGKPAKTSRKGKKAWRANIKTDEFDEFIEKSTKDTLTGATANLNQIPSESLYYVDKSTDVPIKRKIEKNRERVLHHESLLQKNAFVTPVPSSTLKKCKKRKIIQKSKMEVELQNAPNEEETPAGFDLWNIEGEANVKTKKTKMPKSLIPAVEVDPPGCSFNPPFEAHQDALAQAVADEIQKVYRKELAPQPLPNIALTAAIDEQTDSLDLSFAHEMQKVCQNDLAIPVVAPGKGIDEDVSQFIIGLGVVNVKKLLLDADESKSEMEIGNDGDQPISERKQKGKRVVTRVEQNRRIRRKEQIKAEEEASKLENLSKEIDSLQDIMKEIEEEDEEKQRRHLRRAVAKEEKRKVGPPRLGKHKYKPAPLQVLLTEQISGSLRKLEGCPTLVRHQYKSLEKRGLIVPGAK